MLWQRYVFRRGASAHDMWDTLFQGRSVRLLYIAGRGFDIRAQLVMRDVVRALKAGGGTIEAAELRLIGFSGYHLSDELHEQTAANAQALTDAFAEVGSTVQLNIGSSAGGEDDISASTALRLGTEQVLDQITGYTDVILDVSSMPRVAYVSVLTGILDRLIPDKSVAGCLGAGGVNFQVLVAEDATLDASIKSEDPRNDLILIPGFSTALQAESVQDWPCVWFPILGENRVSQLEKVLASSIPEFAEICPVLPHPCRDPKRGDRLLVEYRRPLFDRRQTPIGNVMFAHESNPFEAYRQLLGAMGRYRESLGMLGGCRLVVTPLGSKLITLGASLACFEMRPLGADQNYGVAIPYAGPTRYVADPSAFVHAKPEVATLLLTGSAYQ